MPIFTDPIELESIHVDDDRVFFYLIGLPDGRFKVCALTADPSSYQVYSDPETRITLYWPITKEELDRANHSELFPNNELRTAPFTLDEINQVFNCKPLFHPSTTPPWRFGLKQKQQEIVHKAIVDGIFTLGFLASLSAEQLVFIMKPACVRAIRDGNIALLKQLYERQDSDLEDTMNTEHHFRMY